MLSVERINVSLDGYETLVDASLRLDDGEIVSVLGPSGAGKTTLLRAIAGLVEVSSGSVIWDGQSVMDIPTHQRGFGLMFQGYALFPHLDVAGNIGFGLRMAGQRETGATVSHVLELVGLGGFEDRAIDSLSGGEQQRVALARTLAPNPKLVMLDEPLGALDRNIRRQLVDETRATLVERGVTAVVVTHDRDEAVALGDRLALMRDGRVVQTGTLDQILADPADPWVGEFLA
ncbi:MAG: ABC transporter ATP-binding protein [Actinomycetota bacterium]|nr:ABC transporter ATP-binding protein [Actinomycetota bacterium]